MKMEKPEFSEMPAYKIQTPGNCPEESIQHDTVCAEMHLNICKEIGGKSDSE